MAVVYRCVGILTVDVVFHSQDSILSTFRPLLWKTSSGVVAVGVFAAEALQMSPTAGDKTSRVVILKMEDAGISEEDDDIDSQDSNTTIDHGHLARNCSIKVIQECPEMLFDIVEIVIVLVMFIITYIYQILLSTKAPSHRATLPSVACAAGILCVTPAAIRCRSSNAVTVHRLNTCPLVYCHIGMCIDVRLGERSMKTMGPACPMYLL